MPNTKDFSGPGFPRTGYDLSIRLQTKHSSAHGHSGPSSEIFYDERIRPSYRRHLFEMAHGVCPQHYNGHAGLWKPRSKTTFSSSWYPNGSAPTSAASLPPSSSKTSAGFYTSERLRTTSRQMDRLNGRTVSL
ncbi:hypothetical protein L596_002650 [Steinernema carpocapsae]|uniref:Uncharacterized protein n=1 Tax=Steinernema carpocapsae TaxID=34508 RepID=A0A4U8URQ4_STECR|nr:hypothetical protein L596_002650 [Steinernema carpocapsae]